MADYVLPGLRPTKEAGDSLEGYHNKFVCRILGVERESNENIDAFVIRRNAEVANFKRAGKVDIRFRWAMKLATWVEHIYRHPECLAFSILACQNDEWLRLQRALAGGFSRFRNVEAGATLHVQALVPLTNGGHSGWN